MIVFTATPALIMATVVALAGVITSSGSIHRPGDHFVSSGQHLSSRPAGKLLLYGIGVRMAGLLGLSMLPGASTWRLSPRGWQRALTESRHQTTALRLDHDRLADEPIQRSPAGIARPGRHLARHRGGNEATSRSCPAPRPARAPAGVQALAERPSADVLHRVSRPVIMMPGPARGVITRDSPNVPAVTRNLLADSVNAGRGDRKRTALNRPGVRRDTR